MTMKSVRGGMPKDRGYPENMLNISLTDTSLWNNPRWWRVVTVDGEMRGHLWCLINPLYFIQRSLTPIRLWNNPRQSVVTLDGEMEDIRGVSLPGFYILHLRVNSNLKKFTFGVSYLDMKKDRNMLSQTNEMFCKTMQCAKNYIEAEIKLQ